MHTLFSKDRQPLLYDPRESFPFKGTGSREDPKLWGQGLQCAMGLGRHTQGGREAGSTYGRPTAPTGPGVFGLHKVPPARGALNGALPCVQTARSWPRNTPSQGKSRPCAPQQPGLAPSPQRDGNIHRQNVSHEVQHHRNHTVHFPSTYL